MAAASVELLPPHAPREAADEQPVYSDEAKNELQRSAPDTASSRVPVLPLSLSREALAVASAFPKLVFRPARTDADIVQMRQLDRTLFPIHYENAFYDSLFRPSTVNVMAFEREPPCKLVGHATGRARTLRNLGCFTTTDGYISTLGVSEEYRRAGLGGALLKCIIAELSSVFGCDQISLDVKSDNYPAIALYLKSKFVVESHSPNYYFFGGRYHDAFHMVLDLQSDEAVEDAKPAVGGHSFCVVL